MSADFGDSLMKGINVEMPKKDLPNLKGKTDNELMKAAKEFESIFTNMVMQKMKEMVPDSGLLGGSSKVKFFESMLFEEYSKTSAKTQGIGLADMIYKQLSRYASAEDLKPAGEKDLAAKTSLEAAKLNPKGSVADED